MHINWVDVLMNKWLDMSKVNGSDKLKEYLWRFNLYNITNQKHQINSQQTSARRTVIGEGHTINNLLSRQPPDRGAEKMTLGLINANPVVHAKKERVARTEDLHGDDAVDPLEIYDILFLLLDLNCVFHIASVWFPRNQGKLKGNEYLIRKGKRVKSCVLVELALLSRLPNWANLVCRAVLLFASDFEPRFWIKVVAIFNKNQYIL